MVDMSRTQSHWGPRGDAPLNRWLLTLHFLLCDSPHCQMGTGGLSVPCYHPSFYLIVKGSRFLKATHLLLQHAHAML